MRKRFPLLLVLAALGSFVLGGCWEFLLEPYLAGYPGIHGVELFETESYAEKVVVIILVVVISLAVSYAVIVAGEYHRGLSKEEIENLAKIPVHNPNPVLKVTGEGKILYCNPSGRFLLESSGGSPCKHLPDSWKEPLKKACETGSVETEMKYEGRIFSFLLAPEPNGDCLNIYGFNITERIEVEEKLKLFSKVFENALEGIMITDADANIQSVNPAFSAITGYSAAEAIGKNPNFQCSDRHSSDFYKEMWSSLLKDGCWHGEIWNRRKNGEAFPEWLTISAVKNDDGITENYVAVFYDITNIKKSEEEIKYLAYHDALTGLPNRLLFNERLDIALASARRHKNGIAVFFIDLDDFKKINDSLGHAVGDLFLQGVALRLLEIMRQGDTVARQGGDEFTMMLNDIRSKDNAAKVAQKIIMSLEKPFLLKGQDVYVTASIGVTLFPDDGKDMDTLLRNADAAMYQAKKQGKNIYRMFEPEIGGTAGRRLTLENELRKALAKGEFTVYYQPKLDIDSYRIIGSEALIRWKHPAKGMIPPDRFIPIAEETGLIVPIGQWVLEKACEQNVAWQKAGYPLMTVAVNLSSVQFLRLDLVKTIRSVLDTTGLDPMLLDIEITESMLMGDMKKTVATLKKLSEMGVKISIDDFGTGYSSLNYLRRFDIDTLKIDRSFVCDITTDPDAAAIASVIVMLGHTLGLNVVAEGVETWEQLEFLREQGCDEMQGYLFRPPLPADSFSEILKNGGRLSDPTFQS